MRLDDTEIPGLLPTVKYVDGRTTLVEQIADLVVRKLSDDGIRRVVGELRTQRVAVAEVPSSDIHSPAEALRPSKTGVYCAFGGAKPGERSTCT